MTLIRMPVPGATFQVYGPQRKWIRWHIRLLLPWTIETPFGLVDCVMIKKFRRSEALRELEAVQRKFWEEEGYPPDELSFNDLPTTGITAVPAGMGVPSTPRKGGRMETEETQSAEEVGGDQVHGDKIEQPSEGETSGDEGAGDGGSSDEGGDGGEE